MNCSVEFELEKSAYYQQLKFLEEIDSTDNALQPCKTTLLYHFVRQGANMWALKLLDKGADVNVKDRKGKIALHYAFEKYDTDVVNALAERTSNLNVKDWEGKSPLHIAALHSPSEAVEWLVNKGAIVDIIDDYGNTPLHCAFYSKYIRTAVILVENGAVDVRRQNERGLTILHIAMENEDMSDNDLEYTVNFLIDKGVEINVQDCEGHTPLHLLLKCRRERRIKYQMCALLLKKGANLLLQDQLGQTALHVAIEDSPECVPMLLADATQERLIHIQNNLGEYPLHTAVKSNVHQLKLIIKNVVKTDRKNSSEEISPLNPSAHLYLKEYVLNELLDRRASVRYRNRLIRTLLSNALGTCLYSELDSVSLVLANGALVEGVTMKAVTIEIVDLLINNGAHVNSKNNEGETPLFYVKDVDVLSLLLLSGADVNVKNKDCKTFLNCCMGEYTPLSFDEVLSALLDWGALFDWGALLSINTGESQLYDGQWEWESFSPPISQIQDNILKYLIRRACVNLPKNMAGDVSNLGDFRTYQDSCRNEVVKMKLAKSGNHALYDIFRQLADPTFLTDKKLRSVMMKSTQLKNFFPIYHTLLKSTYRSSTIRVQLIEAASDMLNIPLPREVKRYILTLVDDDSLLNVKNARYEM